MDNDLNLLVNTDNTREKNYTPQIPTSKQAKAGDPITVPGLPTDLTGIETNLLNGATTEAIKLFIEQNKNYIALGVVGAVGVGIAVLATPLMGTYAEYTIMNKVKKAVGIPTAKNLFNKNHDWIRLRIADENDFQKGAMKDGGDFATVVINDDVHMIIGKKIGENVTSTQSMRYRTKEAFEHALPEIEKNFNTKVVEKEGEDFALDSLIETQKSIEDIKLPPRKGIV